MKDPNLIREDTKSNADFPHYIGGPNDWVHNKKTGDVYWDPNVKSEKDLTNPDLDYWGAGGHSYDSKDGRIILGSNGNWNYADALNEETVGHNLFGASYPGGNNPKSYDGNDNFSYVPFYEAEYPAIGHDRRYDRLNIAGASGLFFNPKAIGADWQFVGEELKIGLIGSKRSYGALNSFHQGMALTLGIGLSIPAAAKTMTLMAQGGPLVGTIYMLAWYNYSNKGVNNTPSLPRK